MWIAFGFDFIDSSMTRAKEGAPSSS